MFLEGLRTSRQRPLCMRLARNRVSATVSCLVEAMISRETSSTSRLRPPVRGPRRRSAAMVGSLVQCRSALFNPGGGYKKSLFSEVSSGQIRTQFGSKHVFGQPAGAVWRRAYAKYNQSILAKEQWDPWDLRDLWGLWDPGDLCGPWDLRRLRDMWGLRDLWDLWDLWDLETCGTCGPWGTCVACGTCGTCGAGGNCETYAICGTCGICGTAGPVGPVGPGEPLWPVGPVGPVGPARLEPHVLATRS